MVVIKLLFFWFLMVVCAILNGVFREKVLGHYLLLNDKISLPLSGVLLSLLVFIISYIAIEHVTKKTMFTYIGIGIFWVLLTLVFEYGFGYFMLGKSWSEISTVFNVQQGNLFVLVLLVTLLAPLVSAYFKGYV